MKLAIIGGGWAGLAAAVRGTEKGHRITLFEMAGSLGGRARTVQTDAGTLDNGQHILIGAYLRTQLLMQTVGVQLDDVLDRRPLELRYPDGRGLRMPSGAPWFGFGRAVLECVGWSARDRLALLTTAAGWALAGFRCSAQLTVDELCSRLPPAVRQLLIDPLCIAALNTPARHASAAVLLRVLRDALFSGRGGADLLLPRKPLGQLLPEPSTTWLRAHGAEIRLGKRVLDIEPAGRQWLVDGEPFGAIVLACTAAEAARLAARTAPAWALCARSLRYEPIVTVFLHAPGARLPAPMTALVDGPDAPAQFAFDHGALGGEPGRLAFVVSGAQVWVDRGLEATAQAVLAQALKAFRPATWPTAPRVLRTLAEKRATFRCTPALDRPGAVVAAGLYAAGDYVVGPYPATLEGAVRAGEAAIDSLRA